jgi:flagellar M-ring protein FliF
MFRQFSDSLVSSWGNLTASARVQLVLTGVATAALVVFVVAWGASPAYVNLYSGLSPEDSALIRSRLTEMDAPFKIEGNGTIIQVPRNRAGTMRLDMAAEGIPSSHTGVDFGIFDNMDFMTSKQVIDVNYERAVNGTLQSMLNDFAFVKSSRVFITRSEPGFLTDSEEPSKAAVTLDVTRKPNQKEIDAILGIITSFGPENLTRETITLAMWDGTPLNVPGEDGFGSAGDGMLDADRAYEREYKKKAEDALAAIGVASVVSVSVEKDYSRQSQYEEKFDKGQVISVESDTTSVSSTDSLPQGPAGAISNLPDSDSVIPGGTQTKEETESKVENMELPSTVTSTDFAVGRVKSVSASAFVEAKRVKVLDDDGNPTGEFSYEKYGVDEVESFKVTIATNIGRGMVKDDVEVTALDYPLDSIVVASAGGMGATPDSGMLGKMNSVMGPFGISDVLWWGVRIAIVFVVLIILRKLLKGLVQEEMPEEEEVLEPLTLENELSPEAMRTQEIAEEVGKISQQEPEAVAALLRTWLTEDEA